MDCDVQGHADGGKDLISALDAYRDGALSDWEATGNAHTLILTGGIARIETEFQDPPEACEVSIPELRDALVAWVHMIETREPFSNMES